MPICLKQNVQPADRIFDNRQVQIRDFYNQALQNWLTAIALRYQPQEVTQQIKVGQTTLSH